MDPTEPDNLPRITSEKAFKLQDISIALTLLLLWPVAWFVPSRFWDATIAVVAKITAPVRRRSSERLTKQIQSIMAGTPGLPPTATLEAKIFGGRIEEKLQFLREYRPGGWHPALHLDGAEHIRAAQQQGNGCILWVGPLFYSSLLAKKGLHEAGFEVMHLSRYYHGPSSSEFGRRFINTIEIGAENKYLAERPMMRTGKETRQLRTLVKALRANRIISIACTHYGRRTRPMPLFAGHLTVATGAPGLAISSGAPLLPVFVHRITPLDFKIIVDAPLRRPTSKHRTDAMARIIDEYGYRLEAAMADDPAAFAKWHYLRPGRAG
jgi:lauroyl/myristoyl acyltransferase